MTTQSTTQTPIVTPPPHVGLIYPLATIVGVASLVFAIDQATKYLVDQTIPMYQSRTVIPGAESLLQLTYIINTGAAFGTLPQFGDVLAMIAIVVIVSILAMVVWARDLFATWWMRLAAGLALGGAAGNLWDRLTRLYVIDFIDISILPIFNLADLAIVAGVTLLVYHLWVSEPPRPEQAQDATS